MTDNLYPFIVTGVVAIGVLWLVVFVVRKLVGVALLIALALGVWMVWHDPIILQEWAYAIIELFSARSDGDRA